MAASLRARAGQTFEITLNGTAGTGYDWEFVQPLTTDAGQKSGPLTRSDFLSLQPS